jgi:hypothetical protein
MIQSLSRTSYDFDTQIGSVQSPCWLMLSLWVKLPFLMSIGDFRDYHRELGVPFYLPSSIFHDTALLLLAAFEHPN